MKKLLSNVLHFCVINIEYNAYNGFVLDILAVELASKGPWALVSIGWGPGDYTRVEICGLVLTQEY
jgi:hypothetical protein